MIRFQITSKVQREQTLAENTRNVNKKIRWRVLKEGEKIRTYVWGQQKHQSLQYVIQALFPRKIPRKSTSAVFRRDATTYTYTMTHPSAVDGGETNYERGLGVLPTSVKEYSQSLTFNMYGYNVYQKEKCYMFNRIYCSCIFIE